MADPESFELYLPGLRKDFTVLLSYPNERCSSTKLLKFGSSHISAGRSQPPEDIPDGVFYIPSVRHLYRFALRSSGNENGFICIVKK